MNGAAVPVEATVPLNAGGVVYVPGSDPSSVTVSDYRFTVRADPARGN